MTEGPTPPPSSASVDLHEAYLSACRVWPALTVSEDAFTSFTSAADPDGARYFASDLLLACACAAGDAGACQVFAAQFLKPTVSHLTGRGFTHDVAEEVCQSLGEKMLSGDHPRIRTYSGSGGLAAWVRVVAYRQALDAARSLTSEKTNKTELANELAVGISSQDPELALLRTDCAAVMRAALEDAIGKLEAREKTLLRLYYVGGLSIDRIAVVFRVHRATVSRQIGDVRDKLIKSISRHLREIPGMSESDRRSMNALARSQMSFELDELLRSVQ